MATNDEQRGHYDLERRERAKGGPCDELLHERMLAPDNIDINARVR